MKPFAGLWIDACNAAVAYILEYLQVMQILVPKLFPFWLLLTFSSFSNSLPADQPLENLPIYLRATNGDGFVNGRSLHDPKVRRPRWMR